MATKNEKNDVSVVEVFMEGAKKGVQIGLNMIIPAMILGYSIVAVMQLTGLIEVLGRIFGPVMGIFGLPGESVVVLVSAIFAKAAGAATAANLYMEGVITAAQATILLVPSMVMGTLIGHFARIVLVSGSDSKYRGIMLLIPIITSVIGMLGMRLLLTVMGYM